MSNLGIFFADLNYHLKLFYGKVKMHPNTYHSKLDINMLSTTALILTSITPYQTIPII